MGKDGTQLLRHCVRLLVLVSTDLLAVRLSGIDLSFWFFCMQHILMHMYIEECFC
jgi:hypothetical protein